MDALLKNLSFNQGFRYLIEPVNQAVSFCFCRHPYPHTDHQQIVQTLAHAGLSQPHHNDHIAKVE